MEIEVHQTGEIIIAELISDDILIGTSDDGIDLLGNLYFQGFDRLVIHEKNIAPGFFDLKSGIAGEILQKFSTYRVRLAIVGDFSKYSGKSLKSFISESNRARHINFVTSFQEAIRILSTH